MELHLGSRVYKKRELSKQPRISCLCFRSVKDLKSGTWAINISEAYSRR
ncbi:hypothetical protein P186_2766 [Pyrobaculum ferrireducens]|uniref:Uncharacterized protein n=1 Tax=Pyrobaculum ferrireducens TaxID=1104324 RepID=G7VEX8_9CREN|nr:hypothetical protein P186_2766 [Pyrobaculum ferrireducens]